MTKITIKETTYNVKDSNKITTHRKKQEYNIYKNDKY
jgi:hypothetical protein